MGRQEGSKKGRKKTDRGKEELKEKKETGKKEKQGWMEVIFAHPNSALSFLHFLKRNAGGESCSEALLRILDAPSSPPSLSFNPSHILKESIVAN